MNNEIDNKPNREPIEKILKGIAKLKHENKKLRQLIKENITDCDDCIDAKIEGFTICGDCSSI